MSKIKSSSTTAAAPLTNFIKPMNVKQQEQVNSNDAVIPLKASAFINANTTALTTRNQAKQLESLKEMQQQQQQKKKRTALENISNAGTGSSTNSINPNKAEAAKRSKMSVFGVSSVMTSNSSNAAATTNNKSKPSSLAATTTAVVQAIASTTSTAGILDTVVGKKAPNIKENLSNFSIPSSFGSNLLPASFNPSIKKTFAPTVKITNKTTSKTTASSSANHKSLSAGLVTNKADVKSKNIKDKSNVKIESQTNEAFSCTDSSIERQLATTSLSSSCSSGESLMNTNDFDDEAETTEEQQHQNQKEEEERNAQNVTGWEDIDAGEVDEFSANDYVSFIFNYYRERESRFVIDDYMKRQPALNRAMRLLLVDWMVEVQQQLEFSHEVLYLSVKLLDLYLNGRKVEKEKLQLLGGAAMFIACKFEERMPPIIDDFIYVSDSAYDRKELIKMEIDILKTVKFDIGMPLSYTFLRRYSKCIKADMKFLTLARYILELSLQDYNFAYVRDSLKACAALYLAMKMAVAYEKNLKENGNNETPAVNTANLTSTEWNATLVHYTSSFTKDFIELVPQMNNLAKTACNSKYKTIFKKYSHQVFFEVAAIPHLSDADIELLVVKSKIENSF